MTPDSNSPNTAAAPPGWRRALVLAVLAIYGPNLLMGIYTLGAVGCQHCRKSVWELMAVAPGIELSLPMFLAHLRINSMVVSMTIFAILALLAVLGLAARIHLCPRARWWILGGVFILFSFGAVFLLALIRA